MRKSFKYKNYVIIGCITFATTLAICFLQDLFNPMNTVEMVLKILCNAFSVGGFIIGGIGVLMWAGNEGGFDMFSFGAKSLANIFTLQKSQQKESYYEYVQRKHSNKVNFKPLLIIGGITFIIGLIFYIIYRQYV